MIGQTVSHYRIFEKLHEGGMGVVYRAQDTELEAPVTLKFLPPTFTSDPDAKERFIHEARAASALSHPNICNVREIGETDDGQTYLVMEYCEGTTLERKIEDGELKIEDGIDIAIQIAEGLARAHEAGIVHRDIRPAHILITARGEVKILDFGLARLARQARVAQSGLTLGTPAYMSPEQTSGAPVDLRTDIWSLGALLYEMLSGKRPFEADQDSALQIAVLNKDPRSVRRPGPKVPKALQQILERSMAKKPEERYQTIEDLLADLQCVKGGETRGKGTIAGRLARRLALRRAAVVAALACLAAVGVLFFLSILQEDALVSKPKKIVVVSFENQTGDRKLEYLRNVLQDAITTGLEQSEDFRVTTRERIDDVLRQMGRGNPEYVDNNLGREVCRNVGAEVMAVGTFSEVGERFQTRIRLVDVNTLETLKSFTASGTGVKSLLGEQVDTLTREILLGFGVLPLRIHETFRSIAETMTMSSDAYYSYLRGVDAFDRTNFAEARRFLEQAVQKDSTFATAWFWLALAHGGREDDESSEFALAKAVALADKATEKDKFFIAQADSDLRVRLIGPSGVDDLQFLKYCAGRFPQEKRFWYALGSRYKHHLNDDADIAAQKKALELDPAFDPSLAELAYAYVRKGDFEKTVETFKLYAAACPGDANPYNGLAEVYWSKGMYGDAIATYEQAIDVKPAWDLGYSSIAAIYLHNEEYDQAFRWIDSGIVRASSPGHKADAMWRRACYLHWIGRLKDAEAELREADSVLARAGLPAPADAGLLDGWIAFDRNNFKKSRTLLRKWGERFLSENLDRTMHRYLRELDVQISLGFVDLKAGRLDSVETRLSRMEEVRTRGLATLAAGDAETFSREWSQRYGLLAGYLHLARGNPRKALAVAPYMQSPENMLFASSCPTILGYPVENTSQVRYIPVRHDLVPAAYAALGELDSAIAAYERAVSTRLTTFAPVIPRYHYRLGRIYEQAGMKDKAVDQYRRFLKIWGKADRVFKEPKDAQKRLARLKRGKR